MKTGDAMPMVAVVKIIVSTVIGMDSLLKTSR